MAKPVRTTTDPDTAAAGCDVLAPLRLTAEDYQALARQGFVAREVRPGCRPYYKLRWRCDRRQQTRYLGQDPARAERVRAALESLQRPLRAARQLTRLLGEARLRLRTAKRLLEPQAEASGCYYRGYSLHRRSPPVAAGPGATGTPEKTV